MEERHQYNVREYNKFRAAGVGLARNECEICGFTPYTKNKYREKQDHMSKWHYPSRLEIIIPQNTKKPFLCPDCHYTGKVSFCYSSEFLKSSSPNTFN